MMSRSLQKIIMHIRAVVSNPSISTTLIQTEDLKLLCDYAENMILKPIETAPKDVAEIFLVSIQPQEDGFEYISISNGCWSEQESKFVLGKHGAQLNTIGDACATHWLPRCILGVFL